MEDSSDQVLQQAASSGARKGRVCETKLEAEVGWHASSIFQCTTKESRIVRNPDHG
jgi:hypothetical protein